MKGIIYKWTCNINGKSYIGQTIKEREREKRFLNINEQYTSENSKIDNARKKYGLSEGTWTKSVLKRLWCKEGKEKELVDRLNYWERYFIKEYDTFNNGYNSTDGGDNNFIITDELRERLRASGNAWWNGLSEEEQGKHKENGINAWNNLPMEEQERIKNLGSRIGRERWENMTPEEKEQQRKISSEANIGRYNGHSIERQILSSSSKTGISRSEETKKKIKETSKRQSYHAKKRIIRYDKIGGNILEEFSGIDAASAFCGIKAKHFSEYIKKGNGYYKGFYWEILDYDRKMNSPVGCCWIKRLKRWRSKIKVSGVYYTLGHFVNPKAASEIYQEALKERESNNFENWYSDIINHKLRYYEKYGEKICQ